MNLTSKEINKGSITKESFENAPIAIAAISLGFMSISTALAEFDVSWLRHIAFIFAIICIGIMLIKTMFYPKKVLNEIKNPVAGSIYPTIFMTLMVISVYIAQFDQTIARLIWVFSLIAHFLISMVFIIARAKDFKMLEVIPSWFIPTVGIGVAAVTSKPIGLPQISQIVFYYSLALFIVITPIMIYRVVFMNKIEGPKRPMIMIITAPANICLAGYIAISSSPNKTLISILSICAYISIIYSYVLLPKLIKAKLIPALAPLTFPLAIGVIASQRYVKYLGKMGSSLENVLANFVYIQTIIATLVIAYVVYKTIALLFNKVNKPA